MFIRKKVSRKVSSSGSSSCSRKSRKKTFHKQKKMDNYEDVGQLQNHLEIY